MRLAKTFLGLLLGLFLLGSVSLVVFASGTQEAGKEPAKETAPEEPVEITFWYALAGKNGKALEALIERFNQETPNVTVVGQFTGPYAQTLNKLKLSVQSKTPPHVVQVYDIGTQTLLDSGGTVQLQDLMDKHPSIKMNLDDYFEQALNYYTFNNRVAALPFSQSSPVLYYNKNRFRDAGLDPEVAPKTYKEFMDFAAKLTDPASGGKKIGASWAIRSWLVEQQVALQNGPFYNNGNGRDSRATEVNFNQEKAVNFITLWSDMEKKGFYVNPGRSWADARNNFISGTSAMMLQSTAGISRTLTGIKDKFEMGTAVLPRPEGADGGVVISGNALWVMKGHSEAELKGAFRFLTWLSEPAQNEEWHKATGYYPLRKTTMKNLQTSGYYEKNPHFFTALKQLMDSPSNIATAGGLAGPFPEMRDLLESAIEEILANNADVQGTLDSGAAKAKDLLDRYNRLAP
jgi:sn-glycerol 3-phosphate transport system substrate-binding protein